MTTSLDASNKKRAQEHDIAGCYEIILTLKEGAPNILAIDGLATLNNEFVFSVGIKCAEPGCHDEKSSNFSGIMLNIIIVTIDKVRSRRKSTHCWHFSGHNDNFSNIKGYYNSLKRKGRIILTK